MIKKESVSGTSTNLKGLSIKSLLGKKGKTLALGDSIPAEIREDKI